MFYDCLNTAADSMFVKESALRSILSLALRSHDQIPAFTMASIPAVLHDGNSTLKMKMYTKKCTSLQLVTFPPSPPPPDFFFIMQPLQNCIGPTIRIGLEILCLPYAGFFLCIVPKNIGTTAKSVCLMNQT